MAAPGNNCIRVRLHFDYPPPAVAGCRMCWLLVDRNTCRVVADVESVIRDKFEFSRGSVVSLFVEDCYLPHTESVYVVRDNDCVRVKVELLTQVNGAHAAHAAHAGERHAPTESCRKRRRPSEGEEPGESGLPIKWKKTKTKKKKKKSVESLDGDAKPASGEEGTKTTTTKTKTAAAVTVAPSGKRKVKKAETNGQAAAPKPDSSTKKLPVAPPPPQSSSKSAASWSKPQNESSPDSSSEEEEAPPRKPSTKTPPAAAKKTPPSAKPAPKKAPPPSSSSSDTDSSSDETAAVNLAPKSKPPTSAAPKSAATSQLSGCVQKGAEPPPGNDVERPQSSDSSDEEEIKLVIKRPAVPPGGAVGGGHSPWRGRGRGKARGGGAPGERGGHGGRGRFRSPSSDGGRQEASNQTDALTNVSVILQNGSQDVPKPDYSAMPLLAAPPQVGQRIAFKLLELTENYTPEVSEYKEGKILSFDPTTTQIELELLDSHRAAPVEPGKFDLVYQNPDGSERVEYAVSRGSWVTERWDSLLEPRLLI